MSPVTQHRDSQASTRGLNLLAILVGPLWFCGITGCVSSRMPPPEDAARKYASALEAGDTETLHAMLTSQARANLSREEVAEILARDQKELRSRAKQIQAAAELPSHGEASLFLADGRAVSLALEDGGFHLHGAGLLPARAMTPEQAVREFSDAVRARDYERLRAVLSPRGQAEMAEVLTSLEESLTGLDLAVVDVRSNRAEVEFPSGLRVRLVEQNGVWLVEEIK